MVKLADGSTWAAVTLHGYETRKVVVQEAGVTEEWTVGVMILSCSCGTAWEMPVNEFKGKRSVLDCGCGCGKSERRAILSVNVPVRVLDLLDEYTRTQTRGNRSEAVVRLLERGMQADDR